VNNDQVVGDRLKVVFLENVNIHLLFLIHKRRCCDCGTEYYRDLLCVSLTSSGVIKHIRIYFGVEPD
jgi:hypothetical protein